MKKQIKLQTDLKKEAFVGNINNLFTLGVYWADFSKIQGAPYGAGVFGWIEVLKAYENVECIQKIYMYNGNMGIAQMVIRPFVNGAWYPWTYTIFNSI